MLNPQNGFLIKGFFDDIKDQELKNHMHFFTFLKDVMIIIYKYICILYDIIYVYCIYICMYLCIYMHIFMYIYAYICIYMCI